MIAFTASELERVVAGGDERALRARALEIDYRKSPRRSSALAVAAVLLHPPPSPSRVVQAESVVRGTAFGRWFTRLRRAGDRRALVLLQWCTASRAPVALYPIRLYNEDFGDARRIFRMLLEQEKEPPPYLWLVVLNVLHARLGLSHTNLHRLVAGPFPELGRSLRLLFSDWRRWRDWLASKPQSLRFYGGATNTILGLYDDIFADARTGARRLNRRAQLRFDIGGGFDTSEIERLTRASFVSADIVSPVVEHYDPEIVIHVTGERQPLPADDVTRAAHLARQRSVAHLPFDVLEDSFPRDAGSYAFVSAGFMTSTVRPLRNAKSWRGTRLGHVALSAHAIHRVVEIAAAGKDVDLFTIQRATRRSYKYKTCLLQWREGRLVTLVTTDDPTERALAPNSAYAISRAIDPDVFA